MGVRQRAPGEEDRVDAREIVLLSFILCRLGRSLGRSGYLGQREGKREAAADILPCRAIGLLLQILGLGWEVYLQNALLISIYQ